MADVRFEQATRIYPGTDVPAVDALDLQIEDGEFLVLVGPSGSREDDGAADARGARRGRRGRDPDRRPRRHRPRRRSIATSRWCSRTTRSTRISPSPRTSRFPLRIARVTKAERERRTARSPTCSGSRTYLDRKPGQLSGGQRQRVAMGRAIIREPSVFLMDEPLSNLDAKLRVQMRAEIASLQPRLGITTVYVTHDQSEAMTLGDRVAVLGDGQLQQCDTPRELYEQPANTFVAGFIGSPSMNLCTVPLERRPRLVRRGRVAVPELVRGGGGRRLVERRRRPAARVARARERRHPGRGRGRRGDRRRRVRLLRRGDRGRTSSSRARRPAARRAAESASPSAAPRRGAPVRPRDRRAASRLRRPALGWPRRARDRWPGRRSGSARGRPRPRTRRPSASSPRVSRQAVKTARSSANSFPSSPSARSAAARTASALTRGASTVKITWLSAPRSSTTSGRMLIFG